MPDTLIQSTNLIAAPTLAVAEPTTPPAEPSTFIGWCLNCEVEFHLKDYPAQTTYEQARREKLCSCCQSDLIPF